MQVQTEVGATNRREPSASKVVHTGETMAAKEKRNLSWTQVRSGFRENGSSEAGVWVGACFNPGHPMF